MTTITSKLHKKQRNYLLIFGFLYLIVGGIEYALDSGSVLNWSYLIFGVVMLTVLAYQLYNKRLFSVIKWDSKKLILKAPEQKPIVFDRKAIKSIKLTDKSLTINAGLGSGEMMDLDYFKEEDLAFFNKEFVQENSSRAEAYNFAEAS
ncbi:hypothetical protein [Leeuwenhoekiella parthenopeia]|uniref:PH domain-containing protein n=1 Tax=Leeuwenhoekiella parthenopeia TaxID=2890320 RepID=A0ABS8GMF0_9FLAO|nr:hypothetical protein [Leeuwenhoekiella parthenopeia]MCC4211154.1 hypothetical protein [Leeuwenhoekiella parthenopeia]